MYLEPVSVVSPQNSSLFVGFSKKPTYLAILNNLIFKDTHYNF